MESVKGIVFFATPWNMLDDAGTERRGVVIEYLMTDNITPVVNKDGSRGFRHCKESLSIDKLSKIKEVPGIYDLKFVFKPGSKGKPAIKLDDVEFVDVLEI